MNAKIVMKGGKPTAEPWNGWPKGPKPPIKMVAQKPAK